MLSYDPDATGNGAQKLFRLCWTAYFICYIGKLNYSAAMAEMIENGVIETKSAGLISMLFFVCYGIGQVINGILADRLTPYRMMAIGLIWAGLCNIAMFFGTHLLWFVLFWGMNGFAASMIWAPLLCILLENIPSQQLKGYLVALPSSMALGTLASYGLSALMIFLSGWRAVFFAAGIIQIFGGLLCGKGLSSTAKQRQPVSRQPLFAGKGAIILAAVGIVIFPVTVNGFLKDGSTSWFPTYLSGNFTISPVMSILITMIIPVVNLSGAYLAGLVYRRLRNEMKTSGIFFGLAAAAFFFLLAVGNRSVIFTILFLGITTASMMAVNTMFLSFYPIRFSEQKCVGTITGIINSIAYMGAAICTASTGYLQSFTGWHGVLIVWLCLALIAGIHSFVLRRRTSDLECN